MDASCSRVRAIVACRSFAEDAAGQTAALPARKETHVYHLGLRRAVVASRATSQREGCDCQDGDDVSHDVEVANDQAQAQPPKAGVACSDDVQVT